MTLEASSYVCLNTSISVFQIEIWISSNFGSLAVGQNKTHFQNGKITDPSYRNNHAKFPPDKMGDCRYEELF